ncbi:MAG: hypothetical protein EZS28_045708 [Streblomastix strix]|uniref:Uncharacterized protein n=1 Tax=Streblomastix strix TaxID=222440 RepID=A0A5J4TMX1_9EUKA|nr:MAG: hypothetical protein EZS28_045708 [Streblomastix strix]
MLGAQVIASSDSANKDAIGINSLLFEIQQLGQTRIKTKKYRQLTPSAIWKQIMRPMLNKNENKALEQNQETQITKAHNDTPPPSSEPRGQSPLGHGLTRPNTPRNVVRPQAIIFPLALKTEQEIPEISNVMTMETINDAMHRWMLKGFDLIPVGKDDEGQYWPGFDPGVPYAADWKMSKQQGACQQQMHHRRYGSDADIRQSRRINTA